MRATTEPDDRPPFAFVAIGSFSGINDQVLSRLADGFAELRPDHLDVGAWARGNRGVLAANLGRVLARSGPAAFTDRERLWGAFYRSPYLDRRLRGELRRRAGDRPHAFTLQTQSLFDASLPGVPHFVYTDHTGLSNAYYPDFDPADAPDERWLAREREIYGRAARVFTMSRHVSRSVVEHYGIDPDRVRCVYAGSNVAAAPDPASPRPAGKRILFVGREWERKGGPDLLAAFRLVRERHPDATLVVVGCTPPLDEEATTVLGELPAEQVSAQYRQATVFCMPTLREPFGIAFVEALTHGVPVVATAIGAVPDVVAHGETGLLTQPHDVQGLAEALSLLLGDPQRCRAFGDRGRRFVEGRYTWGRVGGALVGHIREVLVGGS
ncbi:MAG: glycosyltransferase family 4 protein [Solirubrobacteraceae bacterium]